MTPPIDLHETIPHDTTTHDIALTRLRSHPANANVMPADLFDKLVAHIERSGRYPPVIVRPIAAVTTTMATTTASTSSTAVAQASSGDTSELYEILDGHHRVAALRRLGRECAACVIWRVSDAEALVLLATLNRLQGRDDPRKRAALVHELSASIEMEALAARLPEDLRALERLAALHEPPPAPRLPQSLDEMPVAVHFFLLPAQRRVLEDRLRKIGGEREAALMKLCE